MEVGMTVRCKPRADYTTSIIEAGTAACRLYGLSKTNVADMARVLGESPASVYKIAGNFFETDLRVTPYVDCEAISAASLLKEIVFGQHRLMLHASHGDRQMFGLVVLAAEGNWPSFRHHLKRLQADVGKLIRNGVAADEFAPRNIEAAASCFCASTISLWDPRLTGPPATSMPTF